MAKKNITTKGDYIIKATFKLLKYIGYSVKKLPTQDQVFDWLYTKEFVGFVIHVKYDVEGYSFLYWFVGTSMDKDSPEEIEDYTYYHSVKDAREMAIQTYCKKVLEEKCSK